MTDDTEDGSFTRRNVLRTGAAAGAVGLGAAASGSAAGFVSLHTSTSQKRGGRAQVEGDPDRNRPWRLSSTPSGATMGASCMSAESAEQMYLEYDIEYCDGDDDDDDTMYVIPDEAELAQDEVYEFRAIHECKATDNTLVAFGPSNQDADC